MKNPQRIVRVASLTLLAGGTAVFLMTRSASPMLRTSSAGNAPAPLQQTFLRGVVRDFKSTHPDFGLPAIVEFGHYTGNLAPTLDAQGRPVYVGDGRRVIQQFYDANGNAIMPYGDRGLKGGHFDVDIYDAAVIDELFHQHQFDDKFDTATIDIANDPLLLFDSITAGYPSGLRVEVLNPHNSGLGTYVFQDGTGIVQSGTIAGAILPEVHPASLTQFAITFMTLHKMRATKPGSSQKDVVDRDDAFAIRMYDEHTNALVYEISAYWHIKKDEDEDENADLYSPKDRKVTDACGNKSTDIAGTFSRIGTGAIDDSTAMADWFRDVPGVNASATHGIVLNRDATGVYEYATDSFFPIDGAMYGNEGNIHNNFFTYTIDSTATYTACQGQFLQFESNDDAWVYINGKMVIDLGGVQTPTSQYIALDRLGLTDGEPLNISIFYAHRRQSINSVFKLRTNIEMRPTRIDSPSSNLWD